MASMYMAQFPIPSVTAPGNNPTHQVTDNFINTDTSTINVNLMQAMFSSMERRVHSAGLPLGFAVGVKLKELIWMNRYIKFQDLLAAQGESDFQVVHEALELDPALGVILKKTKKQIRSLEHWEMAYMVYVAIYTQRPDLKAHLPQMFSSGGRPRPWALTSCFTMNCSANNGRPWPRLGPPHGTGLFFGRTCTSPAE